MDLKVTDNQIIPLIHRITPAKPLTPPQLEAAAFPLDDRGAILSYSDADLADIAKELERLGVGATITPEPQPDPALLAACQGKVHSRSEALAALAAGKPPITLATLAADVAELKLAKDVSHA